MHKSFEIDTHNPEIFKHQTVGFLFSKQEVNDNGSAHGIGDNGSCRDAKYAQAKVFHRSIVKRNVERCGNRQGIQGTARIALGSKHGRTEVVYNQKNDTYEVNMQVLCAFGPRLGGHIHCSKNKIS